MQARLKVIQENANLKQVKLLPVTVIGRAAECQLKIASTQVSRRHCRITVTDKDVLIEDLNSANGTYVNQERLTPGQPTAVQPGTTLHIGPAAFVVDYTPPLTLETMPTTVIKSSDLPSLQGAVAERPAIIEMGMAGVPSPPDENTEKAPEKVSPAESVSHVSTDDQQLQGTEPSAAASPLETAKPEFLPPLERVEQQPSALEPLPAAAVAAPVSAAPAVSSRGSERKTVVVDDPPMAKPVEEPPKAAAVKPPSPSAAPPMAPVVRQAPPSTFSSERTVSMHSPSEETVAGVPSPVSAPVAQNFDFLAGSQGQSPKAADLSGFDFTSKSPAAGNPPATASKPAASKKSLFGLFGKKEKPVATSAPEAQASPVATESPPEQAASASDTSFDFFDKPTPAFPPQATAPTPSSPEAPPAEDPFAFLK